MTTEHPQFVMSMYASKLYMYEAKSTYYMRETEKLEKQELETRDKILELKMLLTLASCPQCDGSGAYYDNMGEVCQCQWCHEVKQALDSDE